jgi:hypothetical protein
VSDLGQHDGDGIRYAMHLSAPKGGSAQMLRDPAGGWVSWEDYAKMKDIGDALGRQVLILMLKGGASDALIEAYNDWRDVSIGKPNFHPHKK